MQSNKLENRLEQIKNNIKQPGILKKVDHELASQKNTSSINLEKAYSDLEKEIHDIKSKL